MPTYEGFRLKILEYWRIGLAKQRKKKLQNVDFTIISNNCWGGMVYESYALRKNSPTIGLFFMPDDYIKFLKRMNDYLIEDLFFISPDDSLWKDDDVICSDSRFGTYPIGRIEIKSNKNYVDCNDTEAIEVFFLHYTSEKEAKQKWERRIKRINYDKLLVKFNDQNGCNEKHIRAFDQLPYKNKVCFTVKSFPQYKSVIRIKTPKSHKFIHASYEPFGCTRAIDITELINKMK